MSRKMGPKDRIARDRALAVARSRARFPRIVRRSFTSYNKAVSALSPPPWKRPVAREQILRLTKTIYGGVLTSSLTVPVFGAFNFAFNQIDDYASFAPVFDQYRIDWVEWLSQPDNTVNANAATTTNGQLASVVDFDDSNVLSTVGEAFDYNTAVVSTGSFQHYHAFKPRIAVAAYSGAFSSFANQSSQWIDIASPGVQHYGVKVAWSVSTNAVFSQQVFYRLHVSLRSTR